MNRLASLSGLVLGAAKSTGRSLVAQPALEATAAGRILGSFLGLSSRSLHTSQIANSSVAKSAAAPALLEEPSRKFRPLADKELWHEAWMYEDRFGSEESPVIVPSLEEERIIGVTDPEDDNLVVWGILKENEPARQFVENGEFYVLKRVKKIVKVGDVLEALEGKPAAAIAK